MIHLTSCYDVDLCSLTGGHGLAPERRHLQPAAEQQHEADRLGGRLPHDPLLHRHRRGVLGVCGGLPEVLPALRGHRECAHGDLHLGLLRGLHAHGHAGAGCGVIEAVGC